MRRIVAASLCSLALCFAQVPSFRASSVITGDQHVPLRPGLDVSIYGEYLGPTIGCTGRAMSAGYPLSLCDTRVLIDGVPAQLLYVAAGQINFRVPYRVGFEGTANLEVIYRDKASLGVAMPLGLEPATIALESSARVGGPVWLQISNTGWANHAHYPIEIWPAGFGCFHVELRRNGMTIPPTMTREMQTLGGPVQGNGPGPCGALGLSGESHHIGRLPLHLQYRFNTPGLYTVRLVVRETFPNARPFARSPWTAIRILPGTRAERARWLTQISKKAPIDSVSLLTDYLPSILGIPDSQSLALLSEYLHHPDALVRQFATYGLSYWPDNVTNGLRDTKR